MNMDFDIGDIVIIDKSRGFSPAIYKILKMPNDINNPRAQCKVEIITLIDKETRRWVHPSYYSAYPAFKPIKRVSIQYIRRKPMDYMQVVQDNYLFVNSIPGYF